MLPRGPDSDPQPATAEEHEKRSRELAGKHAFSSSNKQSERYKMATSLPASGTGFRLAASGRYELAVRFFTDAISYNPKEFK